MVAAAFGNVAVAEVFLAQGADPSVRTEEGLTAEDYARKRALDDAADLLHAAAGSGR